MQSALNEDAHAFAYDEVYTDLQATRQKAAAESDSDRQQRQSKYISGLLKTAEVRKRENEILFERKLLKDRAAEDDEFGDKPKYVTGAYKEKLKEQQRWLEEQKVIEAREAAEAVGAKGDHAFSSFYSNLLERKAGGGAAVSAPTVFSASSSASAHPAAVAPPLFPPPPASHSLQPERSVSWSGASSTSSSSSGTLQSSHHSVSAAAAENKKRSRWGDDAAAGTAVGASGGAALLHAHSLLASASAVEKPKNGSEESHTADKKPRLSSAVAGIVDPTSTESLSANAPGGGDTEGKATKVLSARERYLQRKQQVQDVVPQVGI